MPEDTTQHTAATRTEAVNTGTAPTGPGDRARGRPRRTLRQQENRAGLALISPTLLVVLAIVVLPLLWTLVLAFQRIRLVNIRETGLFEHYTLHNFLAALG